MTIADELRLIRLSIIDLNGKADMLFSVLRSIRNDQQLRIAIDSSKRPKHRIDPFTPTRGKKGGAR